MMPGLPSCLLISTAYFPPVQYLSLIGKSGNVLIEKHENYNKQSYRNRCSILSANGPLSLIIPVTRIKGRKTPISEVRPDNSCNWQKLHRISIESAYRSAPFFEYYIDDIAPFFHKKFSFLLDLNSEILDKLLAVLNIEAKWQYTSVYMDEMPPGILDIREAIHPKTKPGKDDINLIGREYLQVFQERYGFQPNLSILDLLFNTGPDAPFYIS